MRCARLLALVGASLFAGMLVPAGSSAAVSCEYDGLSKILSVDVSSEVAVARKASAIEVLEMSGSMGTSVACSGGAASVTNTNTIIVDDQGGGTYFTTLNLSGGPFAPGFTEETGSNDEIEIQFQGAKRPRFLGASGVDNLRFGANGANLNAASEASILTPGVDVDVTFNGTQDITVDGAGGNDVLRADGGLAVGGTYPLEVSLLGMAGDDVLTGGSAADQVGFQGIGPEPGNDTIGGGDGADSLAPGPGNDQASGGAGVDDVDYSVPAFPFSAVRVDLSTTAAQDTVSMGVDTLSGIENAVGMLSGGDTLLGDGGANVLTGQSGTDRLNPAGGVDSVFGGDDSDQVEIRDGGPDSAECGADVDTVTADEAGVDTIAPDCENVLFGAAPPGPDGGGGTDSELDVRLAAKTKQRAVRRGGLLVAAQCPTEECDAVLRGAIKVPRRGPKVRQARARLVKLRGVSQTLPAGVNEKLGLRLRKKGAKRVRAALDERRRLPAAVSVSATDAAGNTDTASVKIKVVG